MGSDFGEVHYYQITPILGPPELHHNPQFPAEPAWYGLGNYSAETESEAASNHAVHCTALAKNPSTTLNKGPKKPVFILRLSGAKRKGPKKAETCVEIGRRSLYSEIC